jgi:hypothetical protein
MYPLLVPQIRKECDFYTYLACVRSRLYHITIDISQILGWQTVDNLKEKAALREAGGHTVKTLGSGLAATLCQPPPPPVSALCVLFVL